MIRRLCGVVRRTPSLPISTRSGAPRVPVLWTSTQIRRCTKSGVPARAALVVGNGYMGRTWFAMANALRNRGIFVLPVGHAAGSPGYDATLQERKERAFLFFEIRLGISD